jgi:hypothetical protein
MLVVHYAASYMKFHDFGLEFLKDVPKSVESGFIRYSLLATSLCFMLPTWGWPIYRFLVRPWLRLVAHATALFAGAAIPAGVGYGIENGLGPGFALAATGLFAGSIASLLVTTVSEAANPKPALSTLSSLDPNKQHETIFGKIKISTLRRLVGLALFVVIIFPAVRQIILSCSPR